MAEEIQRREARLEAVSCLVVMGVVVATYLVLSVARPFASPALYASIGGVMVTALVGFGLLAAAIQWLGYFPAAKWINAFLQVSCVTTVIWFDQRNLGPVYALSSMPPLFYALVIALTGFRLQAGLTFFTGVVAVGQFAALYYLVLLPQLSAESLRQIPSLGPAITLMKFLVLAGVGVACGIAALQLRRTVRGQVTEELRNAELQRTFGRYVSPEVAREVVAAGSELMRPRLVEAVILFGDLRNFTAYAGQQTPTDVAATLNDYFEVACRIVESEGGVVNKFLGDGFLAIFDVPVKLDNAANAAARAAWRLTTETELQLRAKGLSVGVAMHVGEVIAGEIGSSGRCEFTVIGQAVNLAARLEAMNRVFGTQRLLTAELRQKLSESCVTRSLGRQTIRGVNDPVEVFELEMVK